MVVKGTNVASKDKELSLVGNTLSNYHAIGFSDRAE